jgi:beta-glucosidase
VNFYFRVLVSKGPVKHPLPGAKYTDMPWEETASSLRLLLNRLWNDYDCPPIYVTENGAAYKDVLEDDGHVHDFRRIDYIREHLQQVSLSIDDGVDVRGYFAWSLMDNFEWAYGYGKRFGLLYIDYATQQRIIKDSGYWFAKTARNNCLECLECVEAAEMDNRPWRSRIRAFVDCSIAIQYLLISWRRLTDFIFRR